MREAQRGGFSPMLGVCASPGCSTLVFGHGTCLEHSTPSATVFVVGRPFLRAQSYERPDRLARMVGGSVPTP
jgi:hypothetical protein